MGLFDAVKETFSGSETDEIWNTISESSHIEEILKKSDEKPQLIYKHSHRCSVCFVSKGNLEQASEDILDHADMHLLNVVNNRAASDTVASELGVRHESPQVILLNEGEVLWHASHGGIDADTILDKLTVSS